jgi:hypothetical protein
MINRRPGIAALMFAALLQASCAKPLDPGYQVQAHAFRQGSQLVLAFENVSGKPLCMPQIALSDGDRSGVHVYLYDPGTRELDEAFALVTRAPGESAECSDVMPGESRVGTFRIKFVMNYFPRAPECFYLVAAYRKGSPPGQVASRPSKPLRVCKADYAGDPSPY